MAKLKEIEGTWEELSARADEFKGHQLKLIVLSQEEPEPPADPKERVRALLAEWQAQDNTPSLPPLPTRNGETPTESLFRKWEEEDATMTDEEREAEDRLWDDFERGINETRTALGMRRLT